MQTSEQTNELAQALSKAQGEMHNAELDKKNPHFSSKYASLAAIRNTVSKPLANNGISYVQMTGVDENGQFVLFTRLTHSSGQYMESRFPLPVNLDKMQAMGSALSYARRYTLAAVCGIAAGEDDDDAESAPNNQPPRSQQQPAKIYGGTAKRGSQQQAEQAPNPSQEFVEQFLNEFVPACQTLDDLAQLWSRNKAHIKALSDAQRKRVEAAKDRRKAELSQAPIENTESMEAAE